MENEKYDVISTENGQVKMDLLQRN